MTKEFRRYAAFSWTLAFVLLFVQYYYEAIDKFRQLDVTYVGQLIGVLFFVAHTAISIDLIYKKQANYKRIELFSKLAMGLGLLGAVVGMMKAYGSLQGFDPNNTVKLIHLIGEVASAGPVSTAAGIGVWLLLELEYAIVYGVEKK